MWRLVSLIQRMMGNPDWCWKTFNTGRYEVWVNIQEPLKQFIVTEDGKGCVATFGTRYGNFTDLDALQLHEILVSIHELLG